MQIVVPMSGTGQRFLDAGYKIPKPLIEVDGKTIIEHVVDLFPGETNFVFICNDEHLQETDMKEILLKIAPKGKIAGIKPHKKGPVYAVLQILDLISDNEEIIVNYCDFSKYWDHQNFLKHTRQRNADGSICAYKGFHPHMLGTMNYAFIRDQEQWMIEIQEKTPFTDNRMNEYASDGTYYFKKGTFVKKYFRKLISEDLHVNGEFYVSMVYNFLVKDGLKVSIYEIQHMLQWGSPRDLQDYQRWSEYFKEIIKPQSKINVQKESINLIPLAGRGKRFTNEGYNEPKPLIPVNDRPMIIQACLYLPEAEKTIFVCLGKHLDEYPLNNEIKQVYSKAKIVRLDEVTRGQACTCEVGLKGENVDAPLFVAASDNGMLWNKDKYQELLNDETVHCIVWSFRHYSLSEKNPQMYGWIEVDENNNIQRVSVKKPISANPYEDHAIVGAFYFRKADYLLQAVQQMYKKNVRINNEFYVDSCINEIIDMGLIAKVFEVDHYVCWGTPNDLKTHQYWQSFFHKCSWHPYRKEKDSTILDIEQ